MRSIIRARRISDCKMVSIRNYLGADGIALAHKHAMELAKCGKYYHITVVEIPDKEDNKPYYQKETRYISSDFQ